jgi:hypothetical protein
LSFFHYPVVFGELMLHVVVPQALYNGLAGALSLWLVEAIAATRRRLWA